MERDNVAQSGTLSGGLGDYIPEVEYRRSFISLRWLLIILASYLTLFSNLSSANFPLFFTYALLFASTNVVLATIPSRWFEKSAARQAIAACDLIFVCGTIYLLKVPNTYLYLVFMLIFAMAEIWRDLRLVLFLLLVVSILFRVFVDRESQ